MPKMNHQARIQMQFVEVHGEGAMYEGYDMK